MQRLGISRATAGLLAVFSVTSGVVVLALGADEGKVAVDGSSTVAPISTAAAEMFRQSKPKIRVVVGTSGTGGGFKKFLEAKPELRTDINDASRPIKPEEASLAAERGVNFIELPIAYDGIAVVVHPSNKFCASLTVEELKKIWAPDSTIKNWKDIRAEFPDKPLKLFGPGTDSGTFDYFTEAVLGKDGRSRSDYTASENDNMLVRGVSGDEGALGYFGFSYYEANKAKLKLVAIDSGDGKPVLPSIDSIRDYSYRPLSRPLFLYVNAESAKRSEVREFVQFYLDNGKRIVEHPMVNYIALSEAMYAMTRQRFTNGTTGTAYKDSKQHLRPLEEVYAASAR
ncbi:MAG: PstS family phosphate ABC transporter substrate-binding protein [Phycisphaerales bacterium]|nr:PstS family phosphate ABC transporter substrate-binding protein [Phycisphaerales bacterium]